MSPLVLVVGASRGIGLELVSQYAAEGWIVHATTRSLHNPGALGEIPEDVTIHQMDVRSADDLEALKASLGETPVDVLIHNAGVNRGVSRADMMAINAEPPIRIAEALLENVVSSTQRRIALITSQMGSRGRTNGGLDDYGESKAALNDAFRQRAPTWGERGACAVVIHPGWVRTDMGGSSAALSVEESASGIRQLMADLTPEMHGRFWTWDGREHDW